VKLIERFEGALLGLAVGDALGATLEFQLPGTFEPIDDMMGGGPFGLAPGDWTDDTSMALCLAESLIECNGFDPIDQLRRYLLWYRTGYLSSTGVCFDIGATVRRALREFEMTGKPYCGSTDKYTAGNGSLMRLAPVPMFYMRSPIDTIEKSGESSRTTHQASTAVDACRYLGGLIAGSLLGAAKSVILSEFYSPVPGYWEGHTMADQIESIASGSYKDKLPPEIRGTAYVVESLEAAIWAFYHAPSFREGMLLAVNLGNDADTTGAVYGQLAGAHYGVRAIPKEWSSRVKHRDLILDYAHRLMPAELHDSDLVHRFGSSRRQSL